MVSIMALYDYETIKIDMVINVGYFRGENFHKLAYANISRVKVSQIVKSYVP